MRCCGRRRRNTIETCVEFIDNISEKYDKNIMIMETGFNWNATRKDGYAGQLVDIDAYKDIYPPSKEGQAGFLTDLFSQLKNTERCVGALYWDPCMIHVEDKDGNNLSGWAYREADDAVEPNVVENTTLFDFDGKALPVLDAFKNEKLITLIFDESGKLIHASMDDNAPSEITPRCKVYSWDGKILKSRTARHFNSMF